jgi:putative ABC transport system ATP-binding protein
MAENERHALIKLDGVTKVFMTDEVETHALSGIQIQIDRGEYIAIAGPSGCGKSTLLSILGLLDSPTEGSYQLNGRPVAELPASERARVRNREIGFIFQSFNLIGDLTVFENVELPLTYRGMRSAERKQRVTAALERVGMAHRAKHLPSQLSGLPQRRGGDGSAPRAASERCYHLHGDPRSAVRSTRRTQHPSVRWPRRRGTDGAGYGQSVMLVSLRNVEKSYPHGVGRTYVLRRIDLDIKEGDFVSIMGPSGAGKSTLLHILGMHDSAWSGEYYFMDQPVHRLNPKQRAELHKKHIGFVFQSYHLLDNLTVYENLEIPLSYRNVSRKDRQSMVADVLDRFQIVGKKDLYPNQLSGGQQQLVGVARAVIANPQVILADEPTGNLHSAQGKEIMDLFRTLNESGTTILQVTHSEVNASYGTRIINLRDGWIVGD